MAPRQVKSKLKSAVKSAPTEDRATGALPEFVGTGDLAALLDYSPRRITQLVQEGVLIKEGRGSFNLRQAVASIIAYNRQIEGKKAEETAGDRLKETRRLEVERSMAREDRKIIALDESMDVLDSLVGLFVEALEGVPARMSRDQTERSRLQSICDEIRSSLASRLDKEARALRTGERAS